MTSLSFLYFRYSFVSYKSFDLLLYSLCFQIFSFQGSINGIFYYASFFNLYTLAFANVNGEYEIRTRDLLHAMQAL